MAETLFPVFDMPEIITNDQREKPKYYPSIDFDYGIGDFIRDGANKLVVCNGHKAWQQWCIKVIQTERFACLAYSGNIGVETESMKENSRSAVESALERTISEALMVDRRTDYVRAFSFSWESDALNITFIIKGHEWEAESLNVKLKIGG